jgi:hypothetical protein
MTTLTPSITERVLTFQLMVLTKSSPYWTPSTHTLEDPLGRIALSSTKTACSLVLSHTLVLAVMTLLSAHKVVISAVTWRVTWAMIHGVINEAAATDISVRWSY